MTRFYRTLAALTVLLCAVVEAGESLPPPPSRAPLPAPSKAQVVLTTLRGTDVPATWPLGMALGLTASQSTMGAAPDSIVFEVEPSYLSEGAWPVDNGRGLIISSGLTPVVATVRVSVAYNNSVAVMTKQVSFVASPPPTPPSPLPTPPPGPVPPPTPDPDPAVVLVDTPWIDDGPPVGGAATIVAGAWVRATGSPAPYSGTKFYQSGNAAGEQAMSFTFPQAVPVGATDRLYAYVYLDPATPPTDVVIQWYDATGGTGWAHAAYWGTNNVSVQDRTPGAKGRHAVRAPGSPGQFLVGPLPAAGSWARFEVPAVAVGLAGKGVTGLAVGVYGGKASFDDLGLGSSVSPTPPPTPKPTPDVSADDVVAEVTSLVRSNMPGIAGGHQQVSKFASNYEITAVQAKRAIAEGDYAVLGLSMAVPSNIESVITTTNKGTLFVGKREDWLPLFTAIGGVAARIDSGGGLKTPADYVRFYTQVAQGMRDAVK